MYENQTNNDAQSTLREAVERYIRAHSKGRGLGFVLTLLLGPLGLLYSNWIAGLILSVIAVVSFASIIGPILCWILAMIFSPFAIDKHNEQVKATAKLMAKE